MKITVWGWKDDPVMTPALSDYVASVLEQLGYRTRVHLVTHAFLAAAPARIFRTAQLIPAGDLDTAAELFFKQWFTCPVHHGWFCRPELDSEIHDAEVLGTTNPRAANALWAAIDRQVVNQAASVPLVNETGLDFVSSRVRNYHNQPGGGLLADQLWLHEPTEQKRH
jgi:ABC-type transport system substrate-binding protein